MDNRDLYTRLKAIKAEVLAMKQSHDYGLNRTDFDFRWLGYPIPSRYVQFRLTIVVENAVGGEPYIDISVEDIFITGRTWNNNTQTLIIIGYYFYPEIAQSYTADIGIISTKVIKTIQLELINE